MPLKKFLIVLTTGWFVIVAASLALRLTIAVQPASTAEAVAWLLVLCVPPVVLVRTCRGAPPPTIAEILYETERRDETTPTGAGSVAGD